MRMRAVLSASVLVIGAVPLVGCAGSIVSVLPKSPPSSAASPTSSVVVPASCLTSPGLISACKRFGDLSTLDPCSLISVGALPPDLGASPMQRDSLDDCAFRITAGSNKAELEVGELESSEAGNGRYGAAVQNLQPQGLYLDEGNAMDGECDDALQFDGDLVDLEINVFMSDGTGGGQSLCDAANEVGTALGTVINSKVQMQHFTVTKNSIATVQACGLLNGSQIAGNTVEGQPETPAAHSCVWQPDPTNYNVEYGVNLGIGDALAKQAADSHAQIHGLDAYTLKYSAADYARCEVDTYRLPWGSANSGLHEIASVWALEPSGQIDAACAAATQMANVVWPKLPALNK